MQIFSKRGVAIATVIGATAAVLALVPTYRDFFSNRANQAAALPAQMRPQIHIEGLTTETNGDALTNNGCFDQQYKDLAIRSHKGKGLINNCANQE
jgi:hypothetical protein